MDDVSLYVSLTVGGQLCGVPVERVRDVLGPQTITRVPLAPPEIAGNLNLRGRIVTTIDVRKRLGVPPGEGGGMSVVTGQGNELYALLVDRVLEVTPIACSTLAPLPPTLAGGWRHFARSVHQGPAGLMVILDMDRLLAVMKRAA